MTDGEYCCNDCGKKCKSKGGLTRHKNSKHESQCASKHNQDNPLNVSEYINLVNQSCKSLEKDTCYGENVRESFKSYNFKVCGKEDQKRFSQVKNLYTLVRKGKIEKFYRKYYGTVVTVASEYFPRLPYQSSVLLATRLADKIASFKKEQSTCVKLNQEHKSTLNEKEKAALQYLGGYVLFTLHKRIRKSKDWSTSPKQQVLAVLQAGKQSNNCETTQRLVDCVDRGGLWKINQTVEQIFMLAETYFKSITSESETHITQISKTEIVDTLEKDPTVDSLFQDWIKSTDIEVSKHVSKDILHQILLLYITVRSFSFAKDVINKSKAQQKTSKSKALRKEIKNCSDKSEINE